MEEKLSTKELYIIEAMRLFAERGYDSVGVTDIAKSVGCTTSALYKHFKNKQALFDEIIVTCKKGFNENMKKMNIDLDYMMMYHRERIPLSIESQINWMTMIFKNITMNDGPRLFRRIVLMERNRHPEFGDLFNEHYIEKQIDFFTKLMKYWISEGIIKNGDAKAMAISYFSPIIALIYYVDNNNDKYDEAINDIKIHIAEFNRIYGVK